MRHKTIQLSSKVKMQGNDLKPLPSAQVCLIFSYPFKVIGQDMQAHLSADTAQGLRLKMGGTHPGFERTKRMIDSLTTYFHNLWCAI